MLLHDSPFAVAVHYDVERGQGKPLSLSDFLVMFFWGAGGNLTRC